MLQKFLKNNIKKISALSLSLIMIFGFSLSALALDGEAPSTYLEKADLKNYIKNAEVFYSSNDDVPIFSPFNLKTTDACLSASLSNGTSGLKDSLFGTNGYEKTEFSESQYIAFTVSDISNRYYKTFYMIPEYYSKADNLLFSAYDYFRTICLTAFGSSVEFEPDVSSLYFAGSMLKNYFVKDSSGNFIYNISNKKYDFSSVKTNNVGFYCYSVVRSNSMTGEIYDICNSGYYTNIGLFLNSVAPSLNNSIYLKQFYAYDNGHKLSSSASSVLASYTGYEGKTVDTIKNGNLGISTSTYSITAVDFFNYSDGDGLINVLNSNVGRQLQIGSSLYDKVAPIPNCLKDSEKDFSKVDINHMSFDISSEKYYFNYVNKDLSYCMIPYYDRGTVKGYYLLLFPNDTNPIVYFKLYDYSSNFSLAYYFQIISKTNYDLYYIPVLDSDNYNTFPATFLGSWDFGKTTFSTSNNLQFGNENNGSGYLVDYISGTPFVNNKDYHCFPSIGCGSYYTSQYSSRPIYFGQYFGNNSVLSMFPYSNVVGTYLFISPNMREDILTNPNLSGGSGSSTTPDDFWGDCHFELTSDAFNGWHMTDFPDLDVDYSIQNITEWPSKTVGYLADVIGYFSENTISFFEHVGGPVEKICMIIGNFFDCIPDYFSFMIFLTFFMLFCFKVFGLSGSGLLVSTAVNYGYESYQDSCRIEKEQIAAAENEVRRKQKEDAFKERTDAIKAKTDAIYARETARRDREASYKNVLSELYSRSREVFNSKKKGE